MIICREILAKAETNSDMTSNDLPTGLSIESASYMENNNLIENKSNPFYLKMRQNTLQNYFLMRKAINQKKQLPKLDDKEAAETEQLFKKEINEEEDFEIPAFLRKQKF